MIYRTPTEADCSALSELGISSFVDAFGHLYSAENLKLFLVQTHSVEVVAQELLNPMRRYRIAEDAGRMIGYCKLGFDHSESSVLVDIPLAAVMSFTSSVTRGQPSCSARAR